MIAYGAHLVAPRLEARRMVAALERQETPMAWVLACMEHRGLLLDMDQLRGDRHAGRQQALQNDTENLSPGAPKDGV